LEEEAKAFFVWIGSITIDKFTKSTFLNLVNFAEKQHAKKLVLIQDRAHTQKDQFRKLFKVLDAKRVGKNGMKEMMTEENLSEWMEIYAVYQIEL